MIVESWVLWTLLAACMQTVRTAGQKYLTSDISAMAATLVRYLFGLPFVYLYISLLVLQPGDKGLDVGSTFFINATLAGILQIVATVLLVRLFSLRNFAVGSTYIRVEILITAILGTLFFGEIISLAGWLAVFICVWGLVSINVIKSGRLEGFWNRSALYGLGSGLSFSLTSLFLRQASLSLHNDDSQFTAALTLTYMVSIQTVMTLSYVWLTEKNQLSLILKKWRPSLFVGITSVLGSIGWFTALTLERAAYVKTLGQIEFFITFLVSVFYFKEMPVRKEILAMLFILGGVVVLLLAS